MSAKAKNTIEIDEDDLVEANKQNRKISHHKMAKYIMSKYTFITLKDNRKSLTACLTLVDIEPLLLLV